MVSHTPESATNCRDISGLVGEVKCCTTGACWIALVSTTGVACESNGVSARSDANVFIRLNPIVRCAGLTAMVRRTTFQKACSLFQLIAVFVTLASTFIDPHGWKNEKAATPYGLDKSAVRSTLDACSKFLFL